MLDELAHVFITPYSILKGRTGTIMSRLLSVGGLELVGARLLFPSEEFVEGLLDTIQASSYSQERKELICNYLRTHVGARNKLNIPNRLLLLLFRGRNARQALGKAVGLTEGPAHGDSIFGTYGDYLEHMDGRPLYFEPGVLHAPDAETARSQLELLVKYADLDGGLFEGSLDEQATEEEETTLVLIKPDSFRKSSGRAGQIIDMFSRAGCDLVAMDLVRLSLSQAEEFHAPLRGPMAERARKRLESVLRAVLPEKLGFRPSSESTAAMADILKDDRARHEFSEIIKFMTGLDPDYVTDPQEREQPSRVRCLVLLYRGVGAVAKVKAVLGPLDPRSAGHGTVSAEFGSDLMRNGAHASNSSADAERERKIVGVYPFGPSTLVPLIKARLLRQ